MKKFLLALLLGVCAAQVQAAVSDSIIVRVTASGTKGVSIDVPEIDLGVRSVGANNVISTVPITVTNTGTVSSSWGLRVDNAGTAWSVGNSAGPNTYSMQAVFNSVQAISDDFNIVEDNLSTVDQQCISLGKFGADESCLDVPVSGVRHLWLNLDMPTTSSSTAEQQIGIVITAL